MDEDEVGTLQRLTACLQIAGRHVEQHRGRIIDTAGDGFLAEFPSAVEAVRSAVELQRALARCNQALPPERRMQFRIGINVGDVIVEGRQIFGQGVNIAARLQAIAAGGGICIAGTVFDQIENKLNVDCEALGEHTVKNIKTPVRVYRIGLEPRQSPPGDQSAPTDTS